MMMIIQNDRDADKKYRNRVPDAVQRLSGGAPQSRDLAI
jgi:hypothetical protein